MEPGTLYITPRNHPWEFQENNTLFSLVKENIDSRGRPKWGAVAKGLPGRTAQQARCRWRRIEDARSRRSRGEKFRNICQVCGELRRGHNCPGVISSALLKRNSQISNPSPVYTANVTECTHLSLTSTPAPENYIGDAGNPKGVVEDEFIRLDEFLDIL